MYRVATLAIVGLYVTLAMQATTAFAGGKHDRPKDGSHGKPDRPTVHPFPVNKSPVVRDHRNQNNGQGGVKVTGGFPGVVRDHRRPGNSGPVVRDHREPRPRRPIPIDPGRGDGKPVTVRDHRDQASGQGFPGIVRDHRGEGTKPVIRDHRSPFPLRPSVNRPTVVRPTVERPTVIRPNPDRPTVVRPAPSSSNTVRDHRDASNAPGGVTVTNSGSRGVVRDHRGSKSGLDAMIRDLRGR